LIENIRNKTARDSYEDNVTKQSTVEIHWATVESVLCVTLSWQRSRAT